MKVWSGTAWAEKPARVWSGSAWVAKPVKVWDGSAWAVKPSGGGTITAPAYRSHTISTYVARPSGLNLDKPAGTIAGDIMLAFVVHAKSTPALNDIVAPAGWTKVGVSTVVAASGTSAKLEVWWKRAGASEPATYFFDVWGNSNNQYGIVSYSGCTTSGSPLDVFSQNSANTGNPATGTGVTTTQANDKLLWIGHNWDGSGTLTPPTGMTERFDNLLYCADQTIATASATGNRTQTQASSNPWAVYMIALKGAGEAAPTAPTASLITSFTPGSERDDYSGEVGIRIQPSVNKDFTWIGLNCATDNTGLHPVKLYNFTTHELLRSADVNLTGKTPGTWGWASIAPITLTAGTLYAVVKETTSGGGQFWWDMGATAANPTLVSGVMSVYGSGGILTANGDDMQYVGLDLGWN